VLNPPKPRLTMSACDTGVSSSSNSSNSSSQSECDPRACQRQGMFVAVPSAVTAATMLLLLQLLLRFCDCYCWQVGCCCCCKCGPTLPAAPTFRL
jgi:hypothetical protein